jgi:hypothetical protein
MKMPARTKPASGKTSGGTTVRLGPNKGRRLERGKMRK